MTGKTIMIALALLVGATLSALAQSQRNYGPDGPSAYGCYGEAFTGTVASRCPGTMGIQAWQRAQQGQQGQQGQGQGQSQQPPPQPWQPWQR